MVKALLKLRSFTEGDVTLGSVYMSMYRGAEKVSVDSLQTKEEIEAIIKDIISPLIIEADGPWGSFTKLYEIDLLTSNLSGSRIYEARQHSYQDDTGRHHQDFHGGCHCEHR